MHELQTDVMHRSNIEERWQQNPVYNTVYLVAASALTMLIQCCMVVDALSSTWQKFFRCKLLTLFYGMVVHLVTGVL